MRKLTVMMMVMNMTKRDSPNCLRKEKQRRIEKEENVNGKKASLMILLINNSGKLLLAIISYY